jgi:hypothetical protein
MPGTTWLDGLVDALVDGLVLDGPLDEHPIAATATTSTTTPYRIDGERIPSTLRAAPGPEDAATRAIDNGQHAVSQRELVRTCGRTSKTRPNASRLRARRSTGLCHRRP